MAILVLAPSVVLAEGDGVITGRVENRSPEGVMPAGVTVTLQIFEGQEFDRHETVVSSADGSFVFSALDTEAIFAYRILVDFQGGLFAGDPITFTVTETVNIVVPVFDTVTIDPGLRTARHSLVLTPGDDRSLGALHVVTLELPGDDALIVGGDGGPAIEFVTYPEVFDFRALDGFELAELAGTSSGFSASMTLKPGPNQFTFSYVFPWEPGGTQLAVGSRPPTDQLLILTPTGDLVVEGDAVRPGEELDFEGMSLESWHVNAPVPGAAKHVWVREPRSVGALAAIGRVTAAAWRVVGAVIFAVILALSFWRAQSFRRSPLRGDEATVKRLLAEIAACDRESDTASPSKRSLRRRAVAKQKLLELLLADARLQRFLER